MYDREYGDKTLNFEPSGGLIQASLVMQDRETDSYWSIMTSDSLAGELKGTALRELPNGEKMSWGDWKKRHPDSLVLSVEGEEHAEDRYSGYFESAEGFRGMEAIDDRLDTKTPVFTFEYGDEKYAVPFSAFEGGKAFQVGDEWIFLHRPAGVPIFYSTGAFRSAQGFEKRTDAWVALPDRAFNAEDNDFADGAVERLIGFDTFWYNWSLIHPETQVLK